MLVPRLKFKDFKQSAHWQNYNPASNPGHYTSKLFNTKFKGNTIAYAFELAKKKFELIGLIPIKNYCLWDIFAREKDINVSKFIVEKTPSTRVVLNTEHYETLLLSFFFQPLMKAVNSFGTNIKFHISGEYDGNKALELHNRIQNYDFYVDADWSLFDSSIDTEVLKASGAIMFANSVSDKEDLRRVFHVISSFVTKYIVLPPGIVVELNRGNPSGHPGVTAINCYVNLIRWSLIGRMIYGEDYQNYMDLEVYGDDAVVMFKYHKNLFKIDEIIRELGYESDPLVDKLYPCSRFGIDEDKGPDFLKRRVVQGTLSWNSDKMFDKLIYQSKKRNVKDQIDLLVNFISTAPGNKDSINLFKTFITYCKNKFSKDDIIMDHIINVEELIYNYNGERFSIANKVNKLYDAEFKLANTEIRILKSSMRNGFRKERLTNNEIDNMRLLFMINEYSLQPFRLNNIKNSKFKTSLHKILIDFSKTERTFYKKCTIDSS